MLNGTELLELVRLSKCGAAPLALVSSILSSCPWQSAAMSRVASIVCAVSLVLYGASCFILPASTPRGAPQQGAGAIAGQPRASSAAPESAGSWSPIAIGAALGLLAAVATTRPALAADLENGEAVFQGNCTACHAGGNNSIVAEKKLKKDALVTYGKYDVGAIITQVTNGNGSMPAFGDKLGPDDIEDRFRSFTMSQWFLCTVLQFYCFEIRLTITVAWRKASETFPML